MKEIMAFLATNWLVGYITFTAVVIIGYIVYSVLLVRSCRKIGYDVGVSAMIPLWNIIVLIKRIFKGIMLTKSNVVAEEDLLEL